MASGHDLDLEALPEGVMIIKLSPSSQAIASAVLQAVKNSKVVVTQLTQDTGEVPDAIVNGVISTKDIPLSDHYKSVQKFSTSEGTNRALYMHNKSLIEVAGGELTHKLYDAIQPLSQDVLVNYPLLYVSDNPKSSSDVLVGTKDSWSPLHQDLPLYCTSAILVLEGHKEFVVVHDDVVPSLRINVSPISWDETFVHDGRIYQDLPSLVHATGGAILPLRAGDLMIMPPRVFHLARNRAPTVSCNFSVCTMESVPLTVAQTLTWIEQSPRDIMHFDLDFSTLLIDCTTALIQRNSVAASRINTATSRKRLPPVRSILNSSVRLMEWYMTLQCIPNDWVQGFWGDVRNRLLEQLQLALPLHKGSSAAVAGADKSAAAAQGPGNAAARAGVTRVPASVPRPLSMTRVTRSEQTQRRLDGHEAVRRSTTCDQDATDGARGEALPRKRAKFRAPVEAQTAAIAQ